MSDHRCPTGWHAVPQHWCREKHGCTCPGCTDDYRAHWRKKMHRLRGHTDRELDDASVTRVRLRMLHERGWTITALADAVGCQRQTIRWTLRGDERRVSARVRGAVERLWVDELRGAA